MTWAGGHLPSESGRSPQPHTFAVHVCLPPPSPLVSPSLDPSTGALCPPRGEPDRSPSWKVNDGPAYRHAAYSSHGSFIPGTRNLAVPNSARLLQRCPSLHARRPLWARSAAPGLGDSGAGSPPALARRSSSCGGSGGGGGGAGAAASWRHPLPQLAPSRADALPPTYPPWQAAHSVAPTAPSPHQAKEKKSGKNTPNETLQVSQQQAEALLPTQMWGSVQDPSPGEFLGGPGRKPPTFHADRRLQTVCCSCNEILISPPFFFLSLAPLSFFFPLWCV